MKRIIVPLLALQLVVPQLFADKITLQDGTVLDGRILEDRGETILLEVRVTESIKDQREFLREEIKSVVETPPDQERYEVIQELVPTPDLLTAVDYEARLQRLAKFEEEFPESQKLDEIAEMRKTLEAEAAKVADGALKLNGIWVSAENQEANAYDFQAALMLREIKQAAAVNNLRHAAMVYEEMQEKVPNSSHQEEAQRVIKQVYNSYLNIVAEQMAQADAAIERREKALESLEANVRERVKQEHDRQELAFQQAYDRAKATGTRWVPSSPYHPRALQEVSRQITASLKRLSDQESKIQQNAGELFAKVWEASEEGRRVDEAKDVWSEFRAAGPSKFYENIIEQRLDALKAVEKAERQRLKQLEEEAKQAERAAREAEREAARNPSKAKTEAPKRPASKPVTTSEPAKPATKATEKPKPSVPAADEEDLDEEGGSSLGNYVLMGGLVLVIILLVTFLVKQKKKQ